MSTANTFFIPNDYGIVKGPITRMYDVASYGNDIQYEFMDPNPTQITSVVNSTTTRNSFATNPVACVWDLALSDTDTLALYGPANNTEYSTTFNLCPVASFLINTIQFNVAFGLSVSAWVSGTVTFNSVNVQLVNQNNGTIIWQNTYNTGLTGLGATGTQMFILNDTIFPSIPIENKSPLQIVFKTTHTSSGTATRQMGMYPNFSFGKQLTGTAIPIFYTPSCVRMHISTLTSNINVQKITAGTP